jgi:hypothetical protein
VAPAGPLAGLELAGLELAGLELAGVAGWAAARGGPAPGEQAAMTSSSAPVTTVSIPRITTGTA